MNGSYDESLKQRIRKARAKFIAMAATYFAGVLNDNFFRQTALLMAVAGSKTYLQGYITVVFTLPFIIFAAAAGFCADRFSKRTIVIGSKFLELAAMLAAAVGIYYENWSVIMATMFLMALQSTIFGPSMNGSIPELYPAEYVVTANAIIRMFSTGAILAGIAAAGFVLDIGVEADGVPRGRVLAAAIVVVISVLGVIVSFGVPKFAAASPNARFPFEGPLNSLGTLWQLRKDMTLAITIAAKGFFYFTGSLEVLVINQLGLEQFNLTKSLTSAMVVVELAGLAAGALLSPGLSQRFRWNRILAPSLVLMAASMFGMAFVPYLPGAVRRAAVVTMLGLAGIAGGIFLIPLDSFVQLRPAATIRGKIIAASSFVDFSAILVSGGVFYMMNKAGLRPSNCFAVMGVLAALMAVWLFIVMSRRNTDA